MSGGGSSGTTYQQSQSESGPPSFLQPYLKQGIWDLAYQYQTHPNAPAYYSGETVAPLSTQSQQAIDAAGNLVSNNPVLPTAISSLNKFGSGAYVDPTTNPDYLKALAASHQPYIDQFNNQILPGVQSGFEGAGRYGSGANQNATQQALKTLGTTISNADAQAGSQYYQNALGQQLQANGMASGLNGSLQQNVAALGAAGQTVDQQRQAQDAAAQAAYNYNANAQMNYISQYLAMLNGGYPGGTNSGSGSTFSNQSSSGGLFGNIMGGVGLGLQGATLIM